MASRRSHAPTNNQQIEYELWVPRSGTYIIAAKQRSSGFLTDTCPLGTRRDKVTYYTALIDNLLWEAAWLRRDAIAS